MPTPANHNNTAGEARIIYKSCPLCESNDLLLHRIGDCSGHALYKPIIPKAMEWMQCKKCAHVFTKGYFTEESLETIFSGTNESQQPGYNLEGQRIVSAKIVERVTQYSKLGTWLDVGCGNGSLLFTAEEWGYKPVGLDLRQSTVSGMRELGVEAHLNMIETYNPEEKVQVISMADSLEHMPYPRKALRAATSLLSDDGVLFLSMPNFECATWQILDKYNANPYWGELEHYHNFSRQRLYDLLKEHGFNAVHYQISERYRVCMEVIAVKVAN